jgi:hypothetical protein
VLTTSKRDTFTESDLRRWAKKGLLQESELHSILQFEGIEQAPQEAREGLNAPTILYYMGTSLALLALGLFGLINWADFLKETRVALVAAGMALVGAMSFFVQKRTPYKRGAGALLTIAIGMTPLLFFAIGDLFAGPEKDAIFDESMLLQATVIMTAALAVMLAVLFVTGAGTVSLAVSLQWMAVVGIATAWWREGNYNGSELIYPWMIAGAGALLILAGQLARRARLVEHSLWFGLSGQAAFLYCSTIIAMVEWNVPYALAYGFTFVSFIILSAALRQLLFLVTGITGVYILIFRIIGDTFGESPFLPLALGLVGVSLIGLAILAQRYRDKLPFEIVR